MLKSYDMYIVAGENIALCNATEYVSFVADHCDCVVRARQRAPEGQLIRKI